MLNDEDCIRYRRQVLIPGWGEEGQERLKSSRVVVAGAGGLGSSILTYLAVAGVGTLRIIDCDNVESSNLNRQTLHTDRDVGRRKVDSAREKLEQLNPNVRVETIHETLAEENVFDLLGDDPIADAMDNLPTRLLLNRVSLERNLPLFHGAVYGLEGRTTTFIPGRTACLACLCKEVVPGEIPVAGVTPGVIGCIQATEIVKHLIGFGELLCDRLLIYDGLSSRFSEMKLKRDPRCPACGST